MKIVPPAKECADPALFIVDGHIEAVQEFDGLSDQEAIEQSKLLFEQQLDLHQTFEVWERARVVYRHAPPKARGKPDRTGLE